VSWFLRNEERERGEKKTTEGSIGMVLFVSVVSLSDSKTQNSKLKKL
jgi:hypothetical protein